MLFVCFPKIVGGRFYDEFNQKYHIEQRFQDLGKINKKAELKRQLGLAIE